MYSGVRLRVAAPGRAVDGVCVERAEESPLRGFLTLCFTHNTLALAPRPQYTIYTVLSAIMCLPLSSLSLALRRSHQNRLREVAIDGGRSRVSLQVLPIN